MLVFDELQIGLGILIGLSGAIFIFVIYQLIKTKQELSKHKRREQ